MLVRKKKINTMKIIDFGLSKIISEEKTLSKSCGTPGYIAPEVITDENYDEKCDIFSVGVIFYMLLTGLAPINGDNLEEVIEKTKECKLDFE